MKKNLVILLSAAILVSSCDTYTGSGAYAGGTLGSLIGSAIGGIAGGGRGADIGSLVGLAGGVALGAAAGAAADAKVQKQEKAELHEHYERVMENKACGINPYEKSHLAPQQQAPAVTAPSENNSGFDSTNSGDDRIELEF